MDRRDRSYAGRLRRRPGVAWAVRPHPVIGADRTGIVATFTLYFDGECPFCVREVRWLQRRDRQGGLAAVDIAAAEFDPAAIGRTREEMMARIHGRRADGEVITGMEVFREAYRAVGLGWITAPTGWPLLRPLFDCAYRAFARNRVRLGRLFGRACEGDRCAAPLRPER
jgi:predicted DCC family thiol-disulfide oxidoreductase YuxK